MVGLWSLLDLCTQRKPPTPSHTVTLPPKNLPPPPDSNSWENWLWLHGLTAMLWIRIRWIRNYLILMGLLDPDPYCLSKIRKISKKVQYFIILMLYYVIKNIFLPQAHKNVPDPDPYIKLIDSRIRIRKEIFPDPQHWLTEWMVYTLCTFRI